MSRARLWVWLVALEIAAVGGWLMVAGLGRGSALLVVLSLVALVTAGGLVARVRWAVPLALTILSLAGVGTTLVLLIAFAIADGYGGWVGREYVGFGLLAIVAAAASIYVVVRDVDRGDSRSR